MKRSFLYYSKTAPTRGNFGTDIYKAGRLDIAIHTIIATFFLSHTLREDTTLHLVFDGQPDPTKHLTLKPLDKSNKEDENIYLSKKNVAGLIKRILYKYKPDHNNQVFPGYWIEKKPLMKVAEQLDSEDKQLFILDPKGEDIRKAKIPEDSVFIIGDHNGLPSKELKRLKKIARPISIGNKTYFASQTVTIVNNELDRRKN